MPDPKLDIYTPEGLEQGIRDKWLMALIDVMNGISEDVADGRYYFNAEKQEGTDVKVTLFPADGTALE
jgi:hypothetical protein